MLAETTRLYLLLAKSFDNVYLAQKSIIRFEVCNYDISNSESE